MKLIKYNQIDSYLFNKVGLRIQNYDLTMKLAIEFRSKLMHTKIPYCREFQNENRL